MPSKQNQEMLVKFEGFLKDRSDFFITENKGLSVAEMTSLRKSLKEKGAVYKIIKNNIFSIALKNNNIEGLDEYLVQSNGILFTKDSINSAKILKAFAKESKNKILVKGGFTEGKTVDFNYINDLAELSSKEELIAKIMYILRYPVQKLTIALDAIIKKQQQ